MSKKNNKKKCVTIISVIIFIILLLMTIGLFGIVISLGILPLKYLISMLIVFLLIYFAMGRVVFNKKLKIWVKVFTDIIFVLLIVICIFVYYYLNSTLHFMDKIKAGKYQIENYHVIVNNKSNITDLNDIDILGIYDTTEKKYNEALKKLSSEIEYDKSKYNNYIDLGNALISQEVDAILMSASYKDIVSEMIENFDSNIKIIHTIEMQSESSIDASKLNVLKDPFNIYISGIDIYGDINMVSRSDVNMVMTVNPKSHKILLTSIPRDYYVQLHGTTGSKDKLTHAGLYGIDMSIETIEDILDEKIDYYVRVNFTTLISLVDAIGGIDIYSDTEFRAYTNRSCYYKVGTIHLGGDCALAYARERMAYIDGDRHRVKNQQDVISAIIKKALSSRTLITKYTNILESMGNSFQTNMPTQNIYDLINKQLDSMPNWNFDTYSLNGFDSENGTYTFGDQQLYVMEPDVSTIEMARDKIDLVMVK